MLRLNEVLDKFEELDDVKVFFKLIDTFIQIEISLVIVPQLIKRPVVRAPEVVLQCIS